MVSLPVTFHTAISGPHSVAPQYAASLWIGGSDGIIKASASDGSVLLRITDAKEIRAIAVDDVNGWIWAFGKTELYAYGFNGARLLSVAVQEAGHSCGKEDIAILADSVITVASPSDGLITNQPVQSISGQLSELAQLTVNGHLVPLGTDNGFSHSVTLQPGLNTFSLKATDTAGNVGGLTLHLSLDSILPQITIDSPVDGLLTNRSFQTAAGRLSEAATLTLNGQSIAVGPGNRHYRE